MTANIKGILKNAKIVKIKGKSINMDEKTTERKLKEYKEHSKYCYLCALHNIKEESLFDGCTINLISVTESGQVVAPYNDKNLGASMSSMLPMCAYHMVLALGGLIAQTTQGDIIETKILTQLEPQSDKILKKLILKLGRIEKNELNKAFKAVAKALIGARQFQKDMKKPIEQKGK